MFRFVLKTHTLHLFLFTLTLAFLFVGCQDEGSAGNKASEKQKKEELQKPTLPIPEDSVLINQVKENLQGLNMEDLNIAMAPLNLNSPFMAEAEHAIRGAFMVYEMEFKLHEVNIEFKSDTACMAVVKHDSRNHNERTYDSQRSVQRYTWKPSGDQWKIYKMEVIGSTPINF